MFAGRIDAISIANSEAIPKYHRYVGAAAQMVDECNRRFLSSPGLF